MKFPLKLLEKALVVKLYGTTCIGQSYESSWLFTHTWLLKVLIVVLKHITIFFEWFPFLICRCSCFQLEFPIPPRDRPTLWAWWWREEGCQQRLTVSGLFVFLKLGLDISELHNSCCFCFLHWHISLVWCQECGKYFAFVFWITKKKIEIDENRVRVRFRSLCPYYTIIMQNYTQYSTFSNDYN